MHNASGVLMAARRLRQAAACAAAMAALVGCTAPRDEGAGAGPDGGATGIVELAVTLPGGVVVHQVAYAITGDGITPVTGTVSLANPGAAASFEVSLPAGNGYAVSLDAVSTDGSTTCLGSARVDVIAGAMTPAAVVLQCQGPRAPTGAVGVSGTFNNCPALTSFGGGPLTVAVGGSTTVSATAADKDNNLVTFAWTASAGTLATPNAATTAFTCTVEGPATLALVVSDGQCQDSSSLVINCLPFCAFNPDGTACDDGNACTRLDRCQAGVCVGTDPVVCTAFDQCHAAGTCSPTTGLCSNPVLPDGTSCALANATAACTAGSCGVVSCAANFGDCDLAAGNGCEASLLTSSANCGVCGNACVAGVSCVSGGCLSPPPTGVAATAGGWSIRVAWNPAPGATGYDVTRSPPLPVGGLATGPSFVDDTVASGVTYTYAVATRSVGGTSAPTAGVSGTPVTKQVCLTSGSTVQIFDATQQGQVAGVRSISGASTTFGFPKGITSNLDTGEIVAGLLGGSIPVFPLAASGNVAPTRVLLGAGSTQSLFAIGVDPARSEVFTADYETGGSVVSLGAGSGSLLRTISGAATQIGHPASLAFDHAHNELFVGDNDPSTSAQRIHVFNIDDAGNVAPKRALTGSSAYGWAVAYDRVHDELLTANNLNNQITFFDRTASGAAAPKRTIQAGGVTKVYALLLDEGNDSLWVVGPGSFGNFLLEVPRGGTGTVAALHPAVKVTFTGHLAKCN